MTPRHTLGPTPLLALAALMLSSALLLWLSNANQALFLQLNHAGHLLPDWLWANLTLVADTLFAVAVLLIAACYRPLLLTQSLVLLLLGAAFVHFFKNTLDVARPAAVLSHDSFTIIGAVLKGHSFPSGHSFTALGCAGLLWLNSKRLSSGLLTVLLGLSAALSRAMVGAHWPLDILVGGAFGLLFACASVWLVNRVHWLQAHGWKLFSALLLTLAAGYLAIHEDGYPFTDPLAIVASIGAVATALARFWIPFLRLLRQELTRPES
ncbi:phosphatase PAP2 family protein [Thalassolituus pacificus]|uniref:undecaprenyl-diphosphate phosphatase n=1 Tax=Thalassolituus pacificus TaxID=2975440 RepID=A0A9X2WH15_9GAMM|nr:phosphatase PAP2 family protein [Thalassolituus pacificus]MCT7359905.1 phosphatase PAP2 family protein [Thalassolituus pacificus]